MDILDILDNLDDLNLNGNSIPDTDKGMLELILKAILRSNTNA